jgi:CHAD domain-containing protein
MVTAGEVLGTYVAEQSRIVAGSFHSVREDAPDAVHATRVACRRLRSTLRTYAPLWLENQGALRRQLAWYARLLGPSRDLEVVSAWLAELSSDPELAGVDRSALAALHEHALARRVAATTVLGRELDRTRFDALTALLPPVGWAPLAEVPAEQILARLAAGEVVRLHAQAGSLATGVGRVDALHEVRKTAKIVRYSFEVLGRTAADAAHWKRVTEALGVAQDAAVASCVVSDLRELRPELVQTWDAVEAVLLARADRAEADGLALIAEAPTSTV